MNRTLTPIDIRKYPELLRLVEEVAITKKPRELKRDKQTVAILMPTPKVTPKKKGKTSIKEALALARGCHLDCCVTTHNEKVLNPVQTWLSGFSAMYHYTKYGMASTRRVPGTLGAADYCV